MDYIDEQRDDLKRLIIASSESALAEAYMKVFIAGTIYGSVNAGVLDTEVIVSSTSVTVDPQEDLMMNVKKVLMSDPNIIEFSIQNSEKSCSVFARLNDYSHDSRIFTRKAVSKSCEKYKEFGVALYLFCSEDALPVENYSDRWVRHE